VRLPRAARRRARAHSRRGRGRRGLPQAGGAWHRPRQQGPRVPLQNDGADTVEANLALGFEADSRRYDLAASILADLQVRSIRLLTNNPLKVAGLRAAGVNVASRLAHWVGENQHNATYLAVKRRKMGHHPDQPGQLRALSSARARKG